MVFYLVYVSSATALYSDSELVDILRTSRQRNAARGVTGALLYNDGNLMQVLEGDEAVVRALYGRIGQDRRHSGLITVLEGHQSSHQFADWSMAYRNMGGDVPAPADGYNTFLRTPLSAEEFGADPSLCQRLLTSFKESLSLRWGADLGTRTDASPNPRAD